MKRKDGFVEKPTTPKRRKLVCGVGVNDALYQVHPTVKGKRTLCPIYRKWENMMMRAYNLKIHAKRPTYKEVTVCKKWHTFTNFYNWMIDQDYIDKQLDKDLIKPDNKIYSPKNCVFVSSQLNSLLTDRAAARGDYPQGVYLYKSGKFMATVKIHDKNKYLGVYPNPHDAHQQYLHEKLQLLNYYINFNPFNDIDKAIEGLKLHAEMIADQITQDYCSSLQDDEWEYDLI